MRGLTAPAIRLRADLRRVLNVFNNNNNNSQSTVIVSIFPTNPPIQHPVQSAYNLDFIASDSMFLFIDFVRVTNCFYDYDYGKFLQQNMRFVNLI